MTHQFLFPFQAWKTLLTPKQDKFAVYAEGGSLSLCPHV